MPIITLGISRPQWRKLQKGLKIRASHAALGGDDYEIGVTEKAARRIASAHRRGKGAQIGPADLEDSEGGDEDEYEGGKIRIGRAFKNLGRSIKNEANRGIRNVQIGDRAIGTLLEKGKRLVPKSVANQGLNVGVAGLTLVNPAAGAVLKRTGKPALDAVYDTDLSQGSRAGPKFANRFIKNMTSKGSGFGGGFVPLGTRGGRLAAGSQAAKDYMANIRKKKGGNGYNSIAARVRTAPSAPSMLGGSVRNHVKRISLNLDDISGNAMARRITGTGFLPL